LVVTISAQARVIAPNIGEYCTFVRIIVRRILDIKRIIEDQYPGHWGRKRVLAKDEFLIREGTVESNLYYVESGSFRVYFIEGEQERTMRFGYAGTFISSLDSFLNQTPSKFHIQAIKKSVVLGIDHTSLIHLIEESAELQRLWIAALSELIGQHVDREIHMLTTTPLDRYQILLNRSPWIFQEVPHKYIASYLRMTPETLSRLQKS
jgi:CRP-like cAMP-binding protein